MVEYFLCGNYGGWECYQIQQERNKKKVGRESEKKRAGKGMNPDDNTGKNKQQEKNGIKEAAKYGWSGVEEDKLTFCMYRRRYIYTVTIKSIKLISLPHNMDIKIQQTFWNTFSDVVKHSRKSVSFSSKNCKHETSSLSVGKLTLNLICKLQEKDQKKKVL